MLQIATHDGTPHARKSSLCTYVSQVLQLLTKARSRATIMLRLLPVPHPHHPGR